MSIITMLLVSDLELLSIIIAGGQDKRKRGWEYLLSNASKSLLKLCVLPCQLLNLFQHSTETCSQSHYKLIMLFVI